MNASSLPSIRRRLRRRAALVLASFASTIAMTLAAPFFEADPHAGHAMAATVAPGADTARDCHHDAAAHCDHDATPASEPAPPAQPVDHTAHCPLCLPVSAPPAFVLPALASARPEAFVEDEVVRSRVARFFAAPLPARGPPLAA